MKSRMLAVILVLTLATWLPAAGQQSATPSTRPSPAAQDSDNVTTNHSCCCSNENHNRDTGSAEKHDHSAMPCCQGKESKEMSCCSKNAKNSKDAMNCCNDKDAKVCAVKDGKACCDGKEGKSCCSKDATACNTKAGLKCCGGKDKTCSEHAAA